jgi:hypothetical protein
MALLPVTAAVSTNAATPEDIPVALTQPFGHLTNALGASRVSPLFAEPGMMLLVGSGLLGLGALVRRATRM